MSELHITSSMDRSFLLGDKDFYPSPIVIKGVMSQPNVDITINFIYKNKLKWSSCNTRSLNISGTNAAPSGTYQAPSGFIHKMSDGDPESGMEQIYVLIHNYGWIITFNQE